MQRKIIIKPGRELTDQETNLLERRKIIFSTVKTSTAGHYDRFAGASISSRTTGANDYISCLMCKLRKIENQENEYEIIFEETDSVRGLFRVQAGGPASGYNMRPLEEQLRHLQETELAELLEDTNIIEQIKEKYKEEKKGNYYSTHYFNYNEQRKSFWNETLDILSNMQLREKAQVEEINDDGSKRLLNIIKDNKDKKDEEYMLIEFPCKMVFKFKENQLEFSKCISSDEELIEETREDIIKRISTINTLINLIPPFRQSRYGYSFVMPEDISSEEELGRLITEIEQIQLENIDIDEISIEEINKLVDINKIDYVFDSIIKNHDVEYNLKRIKDTDDNNLKKRLMKLFSEKDENYTEEQIESVKETLIELLKDENGWKDNASVIAGFARNFKDTLNFTEKMDILQMSMDAHNNYCQYRYSEVSNILQQEEQIKMKISELIDQLFTDEEQTTLAEEIINQKKYQAMIMILKESEFVRQEEANNVSSIEKIGRFKGISNEQKNRISEELIKYKEEAPSGWMLWSNFSGIPYIRDYLKDKKQKQKMSALEQIAGKKTFYIVGRGVVEESSKQQLKCFEDYREETEAYIDIEEAINSTNKGKLHIDIPEKYMGMMIGKQGSNIKRLQEQLKELLDAGDIKIILHPQKEGHVITLEDIDEFIEKQKIKEQEEL